MNCSCKKCGKTMDENNFYTYKNGKRTEICKKCLTMHLDNFNPDTFLWILEKMDVPYVPTEWNVLRDRAYAKDPTKMNGMTVLGKYLAKMRLRQWKEYSWADTEKIKAEQEQHRLELIEKQKEFEVELKNQYQDGLISEAQYKTLMSTETLHTEDSMYGTAPNGMANNPYREENFMSEDELVDPAAELTSEDKMYLAMKWGRLYKPNEWVELEKKYNEMMTSFDIQDSDTIGTLILICKTYLKMNNAIDIGDMDGYQKLSRVYDSLRKSAKFTAAQNKEKTEDFIDSVGQMVAYCEKNGGQIPKFEIETDLDIVDKVIRDLKDYTKSLIYEDAALAREIEEYLKKKEISDSIKKEKKEAKESEAEYEMTDDEITDYNNMIKEQRQQDFATVYHGEG